MLLEKEKAIIELKDALNNHRLCLFAGSGISIDSGLKDWDGFVREYIGLCKKYSDFLSLVGSGMEFPKLIEEADAYYTNNQIGVITALKAKIEQVQQQGYSTDIFTNELLSEFQSKMPNEYHRTIVNTNYRQIITTNYDDLLDKAAVQENHPDLAVRSYGFIDTDNIASATYQDHTALVYAHGKIADVKLDAIVLTAEDYDKIMLEHPAFKLLLESIFINNSVLFVGYGGSDPHFESIITEVNSAMHWNLEDNRLPTCYIMIKRDKANSIRETISSSKRISLIPFDDYSDMLPFLQELQKECPRSILK